MNSWTRTYTNKRPNNAETYNPTGWKFAMRIMALMLLTTTSLLLATPTRAADSNELRDVKVDTLPGDQVQITLEMKQPAVTPKSFTIESPARIAIDLADTKNRVAKKQQAIGRGVAESLSTVEAQGRTRVVINLAKLVNYTTRVEGNKVIVTLDKNAQTKSNVAQSTAMIRTANASDKGISQVDFRRGDQGQGRIVVSLSKSSAGVDIRKEDGKIIADFLNVSIEDALERRLDVTDFATPVKNIDTFRQGGHVRMVITPDGEFEHQAYQSDKVYTIEVKSAKKDSVTKREHSGSGIYNGNRLTLNFQNIQVRAVLQLLADFTSLNIVVSDSVKGALTLRLKDVPWDQALDIILKSKGLAMRRDANVIRIAPAEEIAAIEQLELTNLKKHEELAPLRTEWFQINYATAAEVLKTISAKDVSLLSKRGKAAVDTRTNSLMVQDTDTQISDIRKLLKRLDIPVRQVLIEARVVIASKDFSKDLGVKFGMSTRNDLNSGRYYAAGGPQNTDNTLSNRPMFDMGVDPGKTKAGRFGLAVGRLGDNILQLELSALQSEGKGEIISSPRLITANQKEAFIEQGIEIPYAESTSSGAASVSFKKAVLSLKVKPQITPDDRIILDLEVKKDSADLKTTIGVSQNVAINTREVNTQVLVNNGETIVLGGIYEAEKDNKVNRIPFFGTLPIVGAMFRDKVEVDRKSELLIFVTPKIIKDEVNNALKN